MKRICLFSVIFLSLTSWTWGWEPSQVISVCRTLDKEKVRGEKPDFSTGQFTVVMRFMPLEAGVDKTGNGGMLFAVGSGWFDGIRALYHFQDGRISFQIGRAKEKSAVSVTSEKETFAGVWHDLVCVYDGTKLELYIDGKKEGEKEFDGGISPCGDTLNVGFGGYGIGSLKMAVEDLAFYTQAWTAADVQARFAQMPAEEQEKIRRLQVFTPRPNVVNPDIPAEDLEAILAMEHLTEVVRTKAEETLWQKWIFEEEYAKAAPLLFKQAKIWLKKPTNKPATEGEENQRLGDLLEILRGLDILILRLPDSRPLEEMSSQLRHRYETEFQTLDKIERLDVRMHERVQDVVEQAQDAFQSLRKEANNPQAVKIYLAPNGCDENDGSAQRPLQSLAVAMEKAVAWQAKNRSVIVEVADGEYFCRQPSVLSSSPESQNGATIWVRAAEGAKPRFTFGVTLRHFTPVTDESVRQRFRPEVRDAIRVCDLKREGIHDFGTMAERGYGANNARQPWTDVYVAGKPLTLARYPNAGEAELAIGEVIPGPNASEDSKKTDSGTFHYDSDRPQTWQISENPAENDFYAYGIWEWEWASKTVQVKGLDPQKKLLTVNYPNVRNRFTFHFLNVLEELDAPGEFYLDRQNGLLYLLPPKGVTAEVLGREARVEFPVSQHGFASWKGLKKVWLDGLTFACTRATAWELQDCEKVYLTNCTLEQIGISGVTIQGGKCCGVLHSHIRSVGSCGVRIRGGNRETLQPCCHAVHNCQIHDFSRIDRAYAPAVYALGVGILITNNLMYDSPHHAMRTEGNDLLIARNEVHSVVYDFSDQSGIDIYCDPSYRGIVIDQNFWHHIGSKLALCGQAGIRLDDSISGVVMKKNIFYRSSGGIFGGIQIHGGKDNLVRENLFLECTLALSFSPWRNQRYLEFTHERFSQNIQRYREMGIYPFLDEEIDQHLNRNYIFGNEAINCEKFLRGTQPQNLYCGNLFRTISCEPVKDAHGLATPQELRRWIQQVSGRNMERIGIQPCPLFPQGQRGIVHEISPHYYQAVAE